MAVADNSVVFDADGQRSLLLFGSTSALDAGNAVEATGILRPGVAFLLCFAAEVPGYALQFSGATNLGSRV